MRIVTGQSTMTGTAIQLTVEPYEAATILLRGARANQASIYIGPAGVTTANGFEALGPGETLNIDNYNKIDEKYFDIPLLSVYAVGTSGDKLSWLIWAR